jgi:hypothetical protein
VIDNDDLLYRVDSHYLGPSGRTLPIRIRYSAVGVGAAILVTVFVVARMIVHVPLGFTPLAVMVTLTVFLTTKITRYINADRPLHSVFIAAWNDLVAPRSPKPGQTVLAPVPAASRPAVFDLSTIQLEGEIR